MSIATMTKQTAGTSGESNRLTEALESRIQGAISLVIEQGILSGSGPKG